jgi:transposase
MYMSRSDQYTYGILTDFEIGKVTRSDAASLLGITERSVSRRAKRLRDKGLAGLQHGNRGKVPANKTPDSDREHILNLVRQKYFDFNVTHCLEKLKAIDGIEISYPVFYSWCRKANLVKRSKRRSSTIRKRRVRRPREGMMLQLDGSPHRWNGKDEWVLIGMIDDATSKIPWAEFFPTEDTLSCLAVLQKVIERFGIPEMIYTDKAGWLGGTTKREGFNNFLEACNTMGIRVIFANSPQAKGRVERAWNTFQDRLVPEFRLNQIETMTAANRFLHEEMLPKYWNVSNIVEAFDAQIAYRPVSPEVDLNEIFCLKETRQVKGDQTISWSNEIYRITSPTNRSMKGYKIELRTYQNFTVKAFFAGREIKMELVQEAPKVAPLRVNKVTGVKPAKIKEWKKEQMVGELNREFAPVTKGRRKRIVQCSVDETPPELAKAS